MERGGEEASHARWRVHTCATTFVIDGRTDDAGRVSNNQDAHGARRRTRCSNHSGHLSTPQTSLPIFIGRDSLPFATHTHTFAHTRTHCTLHCTAFCTQIFFCLLALHFSHLFFHHACCCPHPTRLPHLPPISLSGHLHHLCTFVLADTTSWTEDRSSYKRDGLDRIS